MSKEPIIKAKSKVWLDVEGSQTLGQGKVTILKSIDKTGSINATAKVLGRSYRHVWSAVRAAEERLGTELLIRQKGGAKGGGTRLTEEAKSLITKYDRLDRDVRKYADKRFKELFTDVATALLVLIALV